MTWADTGKIVEFASNEYVVSIKPLPAVFAEDIWNPEAAKADLEQKLKKPEDLRLLSTSRYVFIWFKFGI